MEKAEPAAQAHLATTIEEQERLPNYIRGWSLCALGAALCLSIFLVSIEVTIVATSLVSISDDLNGFERSGWVVTAYLLTYSGLLVITAKLSDIFGRKLCACAFLVLYTVFSATCGAAQSMTQLIVLRAMQGIGAAGSNAVTLAIFFELVPPSQFAATAGIVSLVYALSFALGPVLGGLICQHSTWRWIFWLNAPAGSLVIITLLLALPNSFPFHDLPLDMHKPPTLRQRFSRVQIRRVDAVGAAILLTASVLLVAAFESANTVYSWRSGAVIAMIAVSGLAWICFFVWSRIVTDSKSGVDAVFPWRFVQNRLCVALFALAVIVGGPLTVSIITLPLRFQAVYNLSPLAAGVRLLPVTLLMPVSAAICSVTMSKAKIPPVYLALCGSALQLVGFTLISTSPVTTRLNPAILGYEALVGLGLGCLTAVTTLAVPFTIEARDKAAATSATVQFRLLGGVVALALVTTVLNQHVRSHLSNFLEPAAVDALLQNTKAVALLPPAVVDRVKLVFEAAFNVQMRIMIGFTVAQMLVALSMWKRKQLLT